MHTNIHKIVISHYVLLLKSFFFCNGLEITLRLTAWALNHQQISHLHFNCLRTQLYLETPLSPHVQYIQKQTHNFPNQLTLFPNLLISVIMSNKNIITSVQPVLYNVFYVQCLNWFFFLFCEINKHHTHLEMRKLKIREVMWHMEGCKVLSSISEICIYVFWLQILHSFHNAGLLLKPSFLASKSPSPTHLQWLSQHSLHIYVQA